MLRRSLYDTSAALGPNRKEKNRKTPLTPCSAVRAKIWVTKIQYIQEMLNIRPGIFSPRDFHLYFLGPDLRDCVLDISVGASSKTVCFLGTLANQYKNSAAQILNKTYAHRIPKSRQRLE